MHNLSNCAHRPMPIRLFLLWLAERVVKLAFWHSPVSHVGMMIHEDGHMTTTLLPNFGLEDYRRAVRLRPRDGASKQMPLAQTPAFRSEQGVTKEKPPGRCSDLEATSSTLSN